MPYCQNESNSVLHEFDGGEERLTDHGPFRTELEFCLFGKHWSQVRWDKRNFLVNVTFIDKFMKVFDSLGSNSTSRSSPMCDELQSEAAKGNLVLYNVWCRERQQQVNATLHHFYSKETS